MTDPQKDNFIQLNVDRDFGDIINAFIHFLKGNLKKFTNIFLAINGIFIIGLLIMGYLLVSGVLSSVVSGQENFLDTWGDQPDFWTSLVLGGMLFFIFFIIAILINYSLSTSYMIHYEEFEGTSFDRSQVWALITKNLGNIFVFSIASFLIFFFIMALTIILAFIPLLGFIIQYIVQYFIIAWLGISFFSMLKEDKGVMEALGEGWNLTINNFWRAVGVNFVLALLIGLVLIVFLIVPGILIGIYTYHLVQEDGASLSYSIVPTLIYTISFCFLMVWSLYYQCVSHFANGILYYSLREKTYNLHTRSKIDQIGTPDL